MSGQSGIYTSSSLDAVEELLSVEKKWVEHCKPLSWDGSNVAQVGQIDQIDHDLDHLYPNLPF